MNSTICKSGQEFPVKVVQSQIIWYNSQKKPVYTSLVIYMHVNRPANI